MIRTRWQAVDAATSVAVLAVCAFAAQEAGPPAWWQWLLLCAVAGPVAIRGRWAFTAAIVGSRTGVAPMVVEY